MNVIKHVQRMLAAAAASIALVLCALTLDPALLQTIATVVSAPIAAVGITLVERISESSTPDAHKVRDVSMQLTQLRPDDKPLDTILRRMEAVRGREMAENEKIEWEEDDIIPRNDTVSGAHGAGSAGDPVEVSVADGTRWRPDDIIYLPENSSAPGAKLYVADVNGNVVTVYRLDPGSSETSFGTVPALADEEELRRISNAKEEMSNASRARGTMPDQLYNYQQIVDATVEISNTRLATRNYTLNDYDRNQKQVLYDYRTSLEYNTIFGDRARIVDPTTGEVRWFMGGITFFLSTNDLTYTAGSLTEANLIDFMKAVFSGNAGSRTRLFFTTPNLTAEIDKILISSSTLQSTRGEKVLGVSANRLHSSFGDLMLINHQGLEELGKSNYGLILDPAYIRRRPLRPMTRKEITDADVDGLAEQWIEQYSMEVRYEVTHAVVRDSSTDSFG